MSDKVNTRHTVDIDANSVVGGIYHSGRSSELTQVRMLKTEEKHDKFFYCFTKTKQKKGRCSLYMLFYIAESGFLPNFLEANPV